MPLNSMNLNLLTSKHCVQAISSFFLVCFLAFTLQIFFFSPISPDPLELPPTSASLFPQNNQLQEVIKLGEGFLKGPEDVCVDKEGVLYTATRDGWIKKLHKNGSLENWKMLNSQNLLGIAITKEGHIVVCDTERVSKTTLSLSGYIEMALTHVKVCFWDPLFHGIGLFTSSMKFLHNFDMVFQGLLQVSEDGISVLTSHINGSKIRFADDVIEASDGSLYFSVASTKFELKNWYLDVLEAKPHGKLLKYDPSTNETSIVLDNLCFANGVALSTDQDYLVVCETWKYRCLKYWLKGDKKGKSEIFIEHLPGGPDNIKLAPDGSFWIALPQITSKGMEFVHTSKALKHLLATFPRLIGLVHGLHRNAMVVNVGVNGKITKTFDDSNGKVMSFVTSALEFENHLYLGSLNSNFVGKLPLKK